MQATSAKGATGHACHDSKTFTESLYAGDSDTGAWYSNPTIPQKRGGHSQVQRLCQTDGRTGNETQRVHGKAVAADAVVHQPKTQPST